jgi:hypothetical protein
MVPKQRRQFLAFLATGAGFALAGCSDGSAEDWDPLAVPTGNRLVYEMALNEADGMLSATNLDVEPGNTGTVTIETPEEGGDEGARVIYTIEYGDVTETTDIDTERIGLSPEAVGDWYFPINGCLNNSRALTQFDRWGERGTAYADFELRVGASATEEVQLSAGAFATEEGPQELTSEIVSQETYNGYDCFLLQSSNPAGVYNEVCLTREVTLPVYAAFYGMVSEREFAETPRAEMTLTTYEQ